MLIYNYLTLKEKVEGEFFVKYLYMTISLLVVSSILDAGNKRKSLPSVDAVLIVAPHPDDDIIGCGGAIMHHTQDGARVAHLYMTSGDAISRNKRSLSLTNKREQEAKRGAKRLGVDKLIFLREPDSALRSSKKLVHKVAHLIKELQTNIVYIPHAHDDHADHKETHKIVLQAIKSLKAQERPLVLAYEVWTPLREVTHSVDISAYIKHKLKALSEHKSQIADINYIEAVKALNRYRGILESHTDYAECFKHIKE